MKRSLSSEIFVFCHFESQLAYLHEIKTFCIQTKVGAKKAKYELALMYIFNLFDPDTFS